MRIRRTLAIGVVMMVTVAAGVPGCKRGAKDKDRAAHGDGVDQPVPPVAPDDHCSVNSTFAGKPGSLWVVDAKGVFTVYDTATGAVVKTVTGPGWSSGVFGGNGLVWLTNLDNKNDVTPMDATGKALPPLGIDGPLEPVLAGGTLWTVGFDASIRTTVYAITSPTAVAKLPINYVIHNLTASSEGAFMLGAPSPLLGNTEIIHVDPADTKIDWKVEVAKPGHDLQNATLVALPGRLIVLSLAAPDAQQIISIDTATHTASAPVVVHGLQLMTDGVGLYAIDRDAFHELDPTTFAPKRTLAFAGSQGDVVNTNNLVAAGAVWMGRRCGGNTYVHRIDLAAWTVADMLYPPAHGDAIGRMAFVAP